MGRLGLQPPGILPSFAPAIELIFTTVFVFLSRAFDFAVTDEPDGRPAPDAVPMVVSLRASVFVKCVILMS